MKAVLSVGLMITVAVVVLLLFGDVYGQDNTKPTVPAEKVDLPVEKPVGPPKDREEEDDKDKEDKSPKDDEEDEDEEPPIEFFDNEIEADTVVYVIDKTGSMRGRVGHPVTDEKGNVMSNPTKWQMIVAEFRKSVLALSENTKFSAVVYSANTRVISWNPLNAPATLSIFAWSTVLRKATPENKASALSWIGRFSPRGTTPIWDAMKTALRIPDADTFLLHTDGVANVYDGRYHGEWYEAVVNNCLVTKQRVITAAKRKGAKVYTFAHAIASFYSADVAAVGEQMLREIAAATDGTFTKVN